MMAVNPNRTTDITPIVEELKALREQLARESAETQNLLKSLIEEIRSVRGDLEVIRRLSGDII